MPSEQATIRLLISCPDQHGIVAAVSGFLSDRGANIVEADQHATAPEGGTFFMRMAFGIEDLEREPSQRGELARHFAATVAERFDMDWRIAYPDAPKRIGVLASREDHCLLDLLSRWRRGDFEGQIATRSSSCSRATCESSPGSSWRRSARR